MLRTCVIFWTLINLGAVSVGAQTGREVVLLQCGAYSSFAQSSSGAPPVDRNANCTEELRRVLAAGYTLFSVESGDAPAPFFTFVGPSAAQRSPTHRSHGRVDAAVLMCSWNWNDYAQEYIVAAAGISSGTDAVRTGDGSHCANEMARLLSAGFSLARVRVGKDSTDTLFIVLTRMPEGSARRSRESRPRGVVDTAIVACMPGLRSPVEFSAYTVSPSDAKIPADALATLNCGQAVSELLEDGYAILDVQSGESWAPIAVTFSKK